MIPPALADVVTNAVTKVAAAPATDAALVSREGVLVLFVVTILSPVLVLLGNLGNQGIVKLLRWVADWIESCNTTS